MFKDMLLFLKNLSFIDYVFFFTVVFLVVLIISLIYFIRINESVIKLEDEANDPDNLKAITSEMEKGRKPIEFTSYEKEQEEKAIISYEELLGQKKDYEINYLEEEQKGDISVKKVDLNNIVGAVNVKPDTKPKMEVHLISLEKEEAFLKALKELQKNLS